MAIGLALTLAAVLLPLPAAKPVHAATTYTYWFPWFDSASPGMSADNIHIVDPNATPANITITLTGVAGAGQLGGQIPAYGEQHWTWPSKIGGPVQVTSDQPVVVTQRVTYGLSFNEFPALPGTAAGLSFWFPWYDHASPGFFNDNIHLLNPGSTDANVTATLGQGFNFQIVVKAGTATYHSFPSGQLGGPVHIKSDQPVLVSQRVQFNQSFNEIAGIAESDASTFSVINWYDQASPGYFQDDIHLLNMDPSQTASVTLHFPGHPDAQVSVGPQSEANYHYPQQIGGPITINSGTVPVAVTQRVNYWGSFKEYRALSSADATSDAWFNWYDNASPCFLQNNIHMFTSGHSKGTISLGDPARSMSFDFTGEAYYNFPLQTIGGPVHIAVSAGFDPVYPELRTVRCPPPPPPPPPPPVPMPTRLRFPGIYLPRYGVPGNVESVGVDGSGNMGVPQYSGNVAWFNQMPRPGDHGDAVITGHVNWYDTSCAAFCYLNSNVVRAGMDIYVDRADGSVAHFVVDNYNYYPSNQAPNWIYTSTGDPQLTLITCAGDYVNGGYNQRFVVHSHIVYY